MSGSARPVAGSRDPELDRMRQIARRNSAVGRRWFLRSVVLFLISMIALSRGGQIMYFIGFVALLLGVLSISLGRSMRRNAKASLEKIALMEKTAVAGGQRATGAPE